MSVGRFVRAWRGLWYALGYRYCENTASWRRTLIRLDRFMKQFTLHRDVYTTGTGQKLRGVHLEDGECREFGCCIHNPSPGPMRNFPTHWRQDRRIMERICPHGVGHPDIDGIAYGLRHGSDDTGIHGCDGCCRA
jgi:hypothetical protein